jgi:hypothetical protein
MYCHHIKLLSTFGAFDLFGEVRSGLVFLSWFLCDIICLEKKKGKEYDSGKNKKNNNRE